MWHIAAVAGEIIPTSLPAGAHDDQVDAATQALQRIFLQATPISTYLQQLAPPCEKCGIPTLAVPD